MYKIFCDLCGEEIKPDSESIRRYKRQLDRVTIEVMVAVDKVWNSGHVCHDCVLRVAQEGK